MGMLKEFKEFALKGNMIDMAIGIIIGGAFGGVVTSLVKDIITPVIGSLTSGSNFSAMKLSLGKAAADGTEPAAIAYGTFIDTFLNFLIVAFALFLVVKAINTAKKRFEKEQAAAPAVIAPEVALLTEIRDSLARRL